MPGKINSYLIENPGVFEYGVDAGALGVFAGMNVQESELYLPIAIASGTLMVTSMAGHGIYSRINELVAQQTGSTNSTPISSNLENNSEELTGEEIQRKLEE